MAIDQAMFGGIELGGTKTLVAVGKAGGEIIEKCSFPTTPPQDLLRTIGDFFHQQAAAYGPIKGLGVGAFGPIVIDPSAPNYGSLLETNKPGWSRFDLAGGLLDSCGITPSLVTDVAAAGIGESRLGALQNKELGVYLTVGTGIGGAILCRGEPLPARLHPELGHIALQRREDDKAPSNCRFHSQCAEGLAAGPAIKARFGQSLSHFPSGGAEMQLVADYLGQLCAALVMTLSPHRIVLGGGVGKSPGLIGAVHQDMLAHLGGYAIDGIGVKDFLVAPVLGDDAGIIGALCHGAEEMRPDMPVKVEA